MSFKEVIKSVLSTIIFLRVSFIFKKKLGTIKDIAFLCMKPTGIGDLLMDTPSIRLVRKAFPKAKISLITDKHVLRGNPHIDEIKIVKSFKEANCLNEKYDLVILPNKNLLASFLALKLRRKYVLGYLYSWKVSGNIEGIVGEFDVRTTHLRRQAYEVVKNLGVGDYEEDLDEVLFDSNELKFVKSSIDYKQKDRIVLIHPPGLCRSRTWPDYKYKELINRLSKRGFKIVINGASYDEEYNKTFDRPGLINLTGKLNLYELAALCSISKLVIANDCGPMHIALSQKVPTLTLWGVTDPSRRLPSKGPNEYICSEGKCKDLYYFEYESTDNRIDKISVDEVYDKSLELLDKKTKSI